MKTALAAEQHAGGPAGHLLPGQLLAGQPGHGLGRRPRRGAPGCSALGVGLWSLATVGSGLARSYGQLVLARSLLGIGEATYGVIAPTILMDLFARDSSGRGSCRHSTWPCRSAAPWAWAWAGTIADPLGLAVGVLRRRGCRACSRPSPPWSCPSRSAAPSEGVDPERLRAHEQAGASRADYLDLMVNSSYTYAVFGMAAYTFAIGGLLRLVPHLPGQDAEGIEQVPGRRDPGPGHALSPRSSA